MQEKDISDASKAAGISPGTAPVEPLLPADTAQAAPAGLLEQGLPHLAQGDPEMTESANQTADPLTRILGTLQELADSSERYHARAEQREGVIDHLRSEVDRLRRGERRGLLRPLLVEICRLRNDLLRQAEDLPADFDAERARLLLRSYAESVEFALEDNGVVTYSPGEGDAFEPRMHRKVGGEPTSDPAVAGRIAQVRRNGYLDVEANTPIAPAEVVLFGPVSAEPVSSDLASITDERSEL
jgi:molecular chaperone GrpE